MRNRTIVLMVVLGILLLFSVPFYFWPQYRVWQQGLAGKAELARATQNRQIAIEVAKAKLESAGLEAKAEIERANGVAEANCRPH